jgi:hypothetical protein
MYVSSLLVPHQKQRYCVTDDFASCQPKEAMALCDTVVGGTAMLLRHAALGTS